MELQQ